MAVSQTYRDYVADQLAGLGELVIKRMFGGVGLWADGVMFGVVDEDAVFLRVDDETRPEFVARKMPALRPVKSDPKKVSQNYYQLPGDVLDDSEEMVVWAKRAMRAARSPTAAAAKKKAARKVAPKKAPPRRAR
jgi:DNA transformation protein